ncbi:MAG TPA: hypothetical protein VLL77_11865 [Anaerolineales bacterium]|nr:hypothetical protein [Anaerolineales bacterium]
MQPSPGTRGRWGPSQILAAIVLPPSVVFLFLSVVALAVFYMRPARFNAWLARLPGDDLIRTALIFAPATLMAVVVMAVLYISDGSRQEAAEATRPVRRRGVRARQRGGLARRSLWLTVPFLVFVAAVQVVAFVAPSRVDALLDALPATSLLTRLFDLSPLIALAAVGLGLIFGFVPAGVATEVAAEEPSPAAMWTAARVARLGAILILVPAAGLLVMTASGVVLVLPSPERLAWLADRLPAETLIRLGLTFAPAMFLGVVLLAGLYLATAARPIPVPQAAPDPGGGFRSGLAVGVLVAGLGFTALAGMALLLAVVFVLAAR